MKYIRTKDGQIKGFNTYRDDIDLVAYLSQFVNYQGEYAPIKQADTIEELIDLYVIVTEDGRHITMSVDKAVADLEDNYLRKYYFIKGDYVIYGEIWVDDELHKVAKMNEKGELELL